MKIKVSKHKLNIHYRGSPWGSRTQQYAYCLRYAHSQHIESHLGKKQQQAKIPIAFLFSQLHFNNVTSHALFYGGHLVMGSKRCAVQNQGISLSWIAKANSWRYIVIHYCPDTYHFANFLHLKYILFLFYTLPMRIISTSYMYNFVLWSKSGDV